MAKNDLTNDPTGSEQSSQSSPTSPSPRARAIMKSPPPGMPIPSSAGPVDEPPEIDFHTPETSEPTDYLDRIEGTLKLGLLLYGVGGALTAPDPPMVQTTNQQDASIATESGQQHPSLRLMVIQRKLDSARQDLDNGVEPDVVFPEIERVFASFEGLPQQLSQSPGTAARPAERPDAIEESQHRKAYEKAWQTLGDLRQKQIEESRKSLEGSKGKGKKEKAMALINLANSFLKHYAK